MEALEVGEIYDCHLIFSCALNMRNNRRQCMANHSPRVTKKKAKKNNFSKIIELSALASLVPVLLMLYFYLILTLILCE